MVIAKDTSPFSADYESGDDSVTTEGNNEFEVNSNIISVNVNNNDNEKYIKIDTSMNDGFFGLYQSGISQKTYENFLKDYSKLSPTDDFTLSIYTNGGSMFYTVLIANILSNHRGKITALITKYAMSGGTLLALMCDNIQMTENACLGCIDLQLHLPIKHVLPTLTNFRHTNFFCSLGYDLLFSYESTYETRIKSLLSKKHSREDSDIIYEFFCNHTDHEIPIFFNELPNKINVSLYTAEEKQENPEVKNDNAAIQQMMSMMMGGGGSSRMY